MLRCYDKVKFTEEGKNGFCFKSIDNVDIVLGICN